METRMLISRRKEGETVQVGEDIEIRIVSVRKKKVILGIIAPRNVRISATKLSDAEMANTMAAANSIELTDLLPMSEDGGEQVLFLLETAACLPENERTLADMTSGEPA
jgi:carbon storage regulator